MSDNVPAPVNPNVDTNADDRVLEDEGASPVAVANVLGVLYALPEHASIPDNVKQLVQAAFTAVCANAEVCKTIVQAGVVPGGAGVAAESNPAALPGATSQLPVVVASGNAVVSRDPEMAAYAKHAKISPPAKGDFCLDNPKAYFSLCDMYFRMVGINVQNPDSRVMLYVAWHGLPEHVKHSVVDPEHRISGDGVDYFPRYSALKAAVLSHYESRAQEAALFKLQSAVAKLGKLERYSTEVHTLYHVFTDAYVPSADAMMRIIRNAMPAALKAVPAYMFQPSTSDAWDPSKWRDFLACMVQADRTLRQGHQAGGALTSGGSGGSAGPQSGTAAKKHGSAVASGSQHPPDSAVPHQGGGGHQGSVSRKRKGSHKQGTPDKRVAQASVAPPVPLQNAAPRPAVPLAQRKCYKCGQLGHLIKNCPSN
jgi:hypothetical protein